MCNEIIVMRELFKYDVTLKERRSVKDFDTTGWVSLTNTHF